MTLLVTSIMPANLTDLSDAAERAWAGKTDAVEVRIDLFTDDLGRLAAYLRTHHDRTWIVTCRSADEGGHCQRQLAGRQSQPAGSSGNASQRADRLIEATSETNASVDFEFADWVGLSESRKKKLSARLILSAHDFTSGATDVTMRLSEMNAVPDVVCSKLAYTASHITDSFAAFDAIHAWHGLHRSVAAMAMGEPGLWTRVLAAKLGAFATYCAFDADAATAPGQLTLDDMVNRYRCPDMTASTRVFGVLGEPVGHSMGPLLFNRWFADARIDAVYLPLLVGHLDDGLRRFLDGCRRRPWLDVGGFSVTIPHKTAALDWVGDGADAMAAGIGALNTLSFDGGKVTGYNTDCYAAVSSMVDALGCEQCDRHSQQSRLAGRLADLAGVSVDVLGTGGAARAILYGLSELGCETTVFGRSQGKTRDLAEAYRAKPASWDSRTKRRAEILINCTNVGMWPMVDESPMPVASLDGCRLVFDLVYHPLETKLLVDARAQGAAVLSGLDMFIRQASMQFEVWTGKQPDMERGRSLVIQEIQQRTGSKR